jgi:hypothetical protein
MTSATVLHSSLIASPPVVVQTNTVPPLPNLHYSTVGAVAPSQPTGSLPASPPLGPPVSLAPPASPTIHHALSGHFMAVHARLSHLHQMPYGITYNHYLCECHVMEICTTLNIQTGGVGGSTSVDGIQISCDDVADWLGVPHNTFSGMATEFKNARSAHRLLRMQAVGLLPPHDTAFKGVLDAMLANTFLDPPYTLYESSLTLQEASSIHIGQFNKKVRDIIRTYSITHDQFE